MKVAVVYLHREAVGVVPFVAALNRYDPGVNYQLIWVIKGNYGLRAPEGVLLHRIIHINDDGYSLCAFKKTLKLIAADYTHICYLNSWSQPRCNGWLKKLVDVASKNKAGLAGATASCESFSCNCGTFFGSLWRKIFFPQFPNPHIRTTGFCAKTEVLMKIWPKRLFGFKFLEFMHEAGRWSISKRAEKLGYQNWLVGRDDSTMFTSYCWTPSLFRYHNNQQLLISDNQTDAYLKGDPITQGILRWKAWRK
jgi:hypothetical protein